MAFNNALFPEPETTEKPLRTEMPPNQPSTTLMPDIPTFPITESEIPGITDNVGKEIPHTTTSMPDEITGYVDNVPEIPFDITTAQPTTTEVPEEGFTTTVSPEGTLTTPMDIFTTPRMFTTTPRITMTTTLSPFFTTPIATVTTPSTYVTTHRIPFTTSSVMDTTDAFPTTTPTFSTTSHTGTTQFPSMITTRKYSFSIVLAHLSQHGKKLRA